MHEAYSGESAQATKEQWDEYYRQQAMYEQAQLHQDGGPTAAEAHAAEAVQPAYDKQIPEVPGYHTHQGDDWQA